MFKFQLGHFEVTYHCQSPEDGWETYDTFSVQFLS